MDWNKIKDGAKGLAEKGIDAAKDKREEKKAEKQDLKDRIAEMDREGTVYCPKCYSTDLSANKRGFKAGRAFVAGALTLGVGLLAGAAGKDKVEITCLKCGHKFKPGK